MVGAGQFTTSSTNQQNDFNTGQLTVRNNQTAQGAFIDFRADSANGTQGVISKIGGFNVHSGSGYDGLLTISTRQNSNNTMVERMRIKNDGFVGISTNNPVNKLHVEGLNTVARFSSSSSYVDIKLKKTINKKRKISGQIINLQDEEAIELKQNKQTFLIPFNIISECNLDPNYL